MLKGTKLTMPQIGQGQPCVMTYINFIVLESLMLQMEFQGNQLGGSGG